MKGAIYIILLSFALVGCVNDYVEDDAVLKAPTEQTSDEDDYWNSSEFSSDYKSSDKAIYSLRNVQKAFDQLANGKSTRAFNLAPSIEGIVDSGEPVE